MKKGIAGILLAAEMMSGGVSSLPAQTEKKGYWDKKTIPGHERKRRKKKEKMKKRSRIKNR